MMSEAKRLNSQMAGRIYKHNKTGNFYRVVMVAIDSTNARDGTLVVAYVKHKVDSPIVYFVRDLCEFHEKFTRSEEDLKLWGLEGLLEA